MTEFFDLISKINKQHKLVVDIRYSWRTGYDIKVYEDGYDRPMLHGGGFDTDVFSEVTELLLDRYF